MGMDEALTSGPPNDESARFRQKLGSILQFDPVVDSQDFQGYLQRVLENLVSFNDEVIASAIRKTMPNIDPSTVTVKKKGEDEAYRMYGLPNIDQIIDRASNSLNLYNDARDFIDRAEVSLEFAAIPPDEDEEPKQKTGSRSPYSPMEIQPRLYTIAYQLMNAGIDLDEVQNTVYSGKLEGIGRRLTPYKAFLVPQLNRIVIECDSSKNKAYVFDLLLIAQILGREKASELSREEREQVARTLLEKKKSELIDIIADIPAVGAAIDHLGTDWVSAVTTALTEDFEGITPLPDELSGHKNRPLDRNLSSDSYGLFTTRDGRHYGPMVWIQRYFREKENILLGMSAIHDAIKEGALGHTYFLGLDERAVRGWCCEDIRAHVTRNMEVLPVASEDVDETKAWRGFASVLEEGKTRHYGSVNVIAEQLAANFDASVGPKIVLSVINLLALSSKQVRGPTGEVPGYQFEAISRFLKESFEHLKMISSGPFVGFRDIGADGKREHWGSPNRIRDYLACRYETVLSAIERHKLGSKYLLVSESASSRLHKMYCLEHVEEALKKDQQKNSVSHS